MNTDYQDVQSITLSQLCLPGSLYLTAGLGQAKRAGIQGVARF